MSQLTLADCWPRRFPPSSLALQFCEDPPRRNSRCLPKPAPARPSPSSGRRRRDWWCRGAIVSLRILPAVSAHFAARRLAGMASPLRRRSGTPGGRALSTLASPGRCSSRSAKPPNQSIIRCALCCSAPLARFGVASHPRAVSGSFCDGRYNLACGGRRGGAQDCRLPPSTGGRWRRAAATWCWPMR